MLSETILATNIKCGGCATTIRENLLKLDGVQEVEVDVASGRVEVRGEHLERSRLTARLAELGYPEA